MKKVLAMTLGMLLIPFTAFGMETLSDADMESVTGQSGVAITVDDIVLYSEADEEMWFQVKDQFVNPDSDPATNYAAIGFKGIEGNSASTTFINMIISDDAGTANMAGVGQFGLYMDYDKLETQYNNVTGSDYDHDDHIGPLTITVTADLPVFEALRGSVTGSADNDVAGVLIGLPSIEIYTDGSEARLIQVSTTEDMTDPDDGVKGTYGTLWSDSGGGTALLGGVVEIAPLESWTGAGGALYNNEWTP